MPLLQDINSIFDVGRKLFSGKGSRDSALRAFLVIALSLLFIIGSLKLGVSLAFRTQNKQFLEVLQDIFIKTLDAVILGIVSSAMVAVVFDVFIRNIEENIKTQKNSFRKLFCCGFKTDETVSIIIPVISNFDAAYELNSQVELELRSENITGVEKELRRYSSDQIKAVTRVDFIGCMYLVSAFSRVGLPIPQIIFDDSGNRNKSHSDIKKHDDTRVYLAIGLLSNKKTNEANSLDNEDSFVRFFKIEDEPIPGKKKRKHSIKIAYFDKDKPVPEREWIPYEITWDLVDRYSDKGCDYGLFAKTYVNGKIVFIIGGTVEEGTVKLSEYICGNWFDILKRLSSEGQVDKQPFSAVFAIPLNERLNRNVTLLRTCIPSSS